MTDEELALEIHRLSNELHERLLVKRPDESWLQQQLRTARIKVMSWPTWKQKAMAVTPS